MREINNILIFKPAAIGDLLHLTPVVRALRALAPGAFVTVVVGTELTASVFTGNPLVDEVLVYERRGVHGTIGGFLALWRRLRSRKYDLVVNYQRSRLRSWALLTAALPCRFLVYHKRRRRIIHAILDHLRPLAALGVDPYKVDPQLDFFPSEADEAYANGFLRELRLAGRRLVAFNPGTSQLNKCWPLDRYAALGDYLVEKHGCEIVVFGSQAEAPLARAIREQMRHPLHDLCGCSLGELGALLKRCEFLVTGDTGPMHLASAVGTRVLALYGPISPLRSGPVGPQHRILIHDELDCCPCNSFDCKNPTFRLCMTMITVAEVMQVATEMIEASGDPAPHAPQLHPAIRLFQPTA
jgi:ADP-heptose:LPS heptosyltransferase